MAGYLGNKQKISGRYTVDEFTSSGGTTYTLGSAPGAKNNIQVSAGGLVQYPSAYSVSGTTLTLTGVPSGQKVVVRHMGDTIPFPLLDDNVVTNAKLADDAVGLAELSATGTASSSNFLRGDNSWQAAGGGAWTLIGSSVASNSASLTITGLTSTYSTYACMLDSIVVASDGANVYIRVGDASGIDSGASDYAWVDRASRDDSTAANFNGSASTPKIRAGDINTGNAAGEGYGGQFFIYNAANASLQTFISGEAVIIETGGNMEYASFAARRKAAFAVDRVQISLSSGNIISGRFTVWGIKHT